MRRCDGRSEGRGDLDVGMRHEVYYVLVFSHEGICKGCHAVAIGIPGMIRHDVLPGLLAEPEPEESVIEQPSQGLLERFGISRLHNQPGDMVLHDIADG
jgi:hypothetical protein